MFDRIIFTELDKWLNKSNRKPLVIRGARQVGKTTVIGQFSREGFLEPAALYGHSN
jgi:predicted AAA+ superfamily ATPase